jgi:hypothetical protein
VTVTSPGLTGSEQAAMLILMAESRPVSNTELGTLGPRLEKPSRDKLNQLKLVKTTKIGRRLVHELTDKGWRQCAELLRGGPPPGTTGRVKALYVVLAALGRYLDRTDQRLADVFWPAESAGGEGPVENRIRDAYSRLAQRPGGWVGLVRLRAELDDVPRSSVDSALISLYQQPGVSLIPEENQKVLTAADRRAAVMIGDQDKHLIAIEA